MASETRGLRSKRGKGDHRCTPPDIWLVARHAIGIKEWDLDVATNPYATLPARTKWFGLKEDGSDSALIQKWFGHAWENPPFTKLGEFAERAIDQLPHVASLTFLGPGDTSTAWWRLLARNMDAWAAWPKRAHFPMPGNPSGGAPGPIHLFYSGPRSNRWRRVMEHVGCITYPGG